MKKILRVLKWAGIVIVAAFILLVIIRIPYVANKQATKEQVAKIHNTKLTLDDVMGTNLPPDPGVEADKTVAGVDANKNGIRDDVELAIFKEYPESAKTRAVLLQYALALQMETIQPIVNTETVTEVVREQSRADSCVANQLVPRDTPESSRSSEQVDKINSYISFVENKQINTEDRKNFNKDFYSFLGSFGDSTNVECDLDFTLLKD